jgi:hypothetical protein
MPAPSYHVGTNRGLIGVEVQPGGAGAPRGVVPAMVLVDESGASVGTAANPQQTVTGPSTASGAAIAPVTALNSAAISVKTSSGNFYGASVVNNAASSVAGYLIAYNAPGVPANTSALTAALILGVKAVAAGADGSIDPTNVPDRFSAGVVVLFSTSLATRTDPAVLPVFLKGRAV